MARDQEWRPGTRAIQFQVPGRRSAGQITDATRRSARWIVRNVLHQLTRKEIPARSRGRNVRRYLFVCSCSWKSEPSTSATREATWHLDQASQEEE